MRTIFVCLALLISISQGLSQEETLVKACFDGYKSAILDSDGKEALQWVNTKTKDYYSSILKRALTADSAAVNEMNVIDKITVLRVRMSLSADEISKMDGKSFFIYAIDEGMVGKNSVENVELGEIDIKGNKASGAFIVRGNPAPFSFEFEKEKGKWKIDLTSLFPMSNQGLTMMMEQGGYEENDFLLRILGSLSNEGESPGMHLWKAPEKSK